MKLQPRIYRPGLKYADTRNDVRRVRRVLRQLAAYARSIDGHGIAQDLARVSRLPRAGVAK